MELTKSNSGITDLRRRRKTNMYSAFYQIKSERAKQGYIDTEERVQNKTMLENETSTCLSKRLRDRKSAQTEGVMNFTVFFKTLLYELPPLPISCLLCTCCDGYESAKNRLLAPPSFTLVGLLQYLFMTFITSMPFIAVILSFILKTPEEKEWSLIEPLQLMVYYTLWKITLAAKHSVAGNLHSNGLYGLDSPRFSIAERMSRIQFNTWVLGDNNQPGAVLEELYTASLRADYDLNLLTFDVGSEKTARTLTKLVNIWKIRAATSLGCSYKPIPEWHPAHADHWNQQFVPVSVSKNEEDGKNNSDKNPGDPGDPGDLKDKEAAGGSINGTTIVPEDKAEQTGNQGKEAMNESKSTTASSKYVLNIIDNNSTSEKNETSITTASAASSSSLPKVLPRCPITKYAEDGDRFCLFEAYFRNTNDTQSTEIEEMIRNGKVPASYLAWLLGVQNWRYRPIGGIMALTFFCCFLMTFLPNICRLIFTDKPAFGDSNSARLVIGFTVVGTFFPIMLLFNYNVNCSLEMGFRYKASMFMRDILLPEGGVIDDGKLPIELSTRVRLSLSRACNAVSWGAVRELMHGSSFCPFMHAKANAYVACSFAAAIGVSAIASFGGLIIGSGEAGVWVTLPGVIKSLLFSLALAVFVLFAYRVNFSTRYQRLEISKARMVVLAEITELEIQKYVLESEMDRMTKEEKVHQNSTNKSTQIAMELAELRNASELLQVVDKQTTVSDHANPVRAMGLVADPAVLGIILSILGATLYVEAQKLSFLLVPSNEIATTTMLGPVPSPSSSSNGF